MGERASLLACPGSSVSRPLAWEIVVPSPLDPSICSQFLSVDLPRTLSLSSAATQIGPPQYVLILALWPA